MDVVHINDLADPRIAPYANMRDAELAQRADPSDAAAHGGVFIAEGELVVRRLIRSRFTTRSVLTTPTRLATIGDGLAGLGPDTPVYLAEQRVMDRIVGFNMHRGVLAIGVRGEPPALADVVARPGPLLVLEDVNNNDNLGAIFRNAAALGGPGCGVLLSPRCADPLYRKSLRVSMGAVLSVPFTRATAWPGDLRRLRGAGFALWGLTPRPEERELEALVEEARAQGTTRLALLLGAEGPGLSQSALEACDALARIAMRPAGDGVDSLNVGVAAGIALYALGAAKANRSDSGR